MILTFLRIRYIQKCIPNLIRVNYSLLFSKFDVYFEMLKKSLL